MNKQQKVTINGIVYDAHTGMRLENATSSPKTESTKPNRPTAHTLHKKTERTKTLSRKHVKAPHHPAASPTPKAAKQSPLISKFATDITPRKPTVTPTQLDVVPVKHPLQHAIAHKTAAIPKQQHSTQPRPAHEIKQRAISDAMHKATPTKQDKQSFRQRHPRVVSIASASLALVLLAGYLTYVNLPSLSVRVAAVQAGIEATYPSYQPSGYSLDGPVAFSEGQVSMKFGANAGPQKFTVNQVESSWNSIALLDNYVEEVSGGDFSTYTDSGLTVYVYDTNAAWVNGGILHTIEGDATLTNDQIRRIATSM